MKWLAKYKYEIGALLLIIVAYFVSRLVQINNLPIFTDEAIYVRWSQIAGNDANWRFISLTDGKQPSFIWLAMTALKFIDDPLIAARLVSVFAGFGTLMGLFFLGREVFKNRWIGLLSSLVYVLSPFALVYDRMALYESLVGFFFVWSVYFIVMLIRYVRLDYALLAGLTIGAAVLTKANGFYSLYMIPFSLLLFDWKSKQRIIRFLKLVFFSCIVALLTYGMYSILRLSPFFHIIDQKTAVFIYPLKEWIEHPFTFFWGNLRVGQWDWLWRYVTPPLLLLIIGSFFVEKKYIREKITLFLWFLLPFVGLALFGKVLYPRYIFSMVLTLFPLIAFTLFYVQKYFKSKVLYGLFFVLSFSYALYVQYFILVDFIKAPLPRPDLDQYIRTWPAGNATLDAVEFFNQESKKEKIHVITQGTFGLYPFAFEIYLQKNPNVVISGFWPTELPVLKETAEKKSIPTTYVVFYQPCPDCKAAGLPPEGWPLTLVKRYQKGNDYTFLSIYRLESK